MSSSFFPSSRWVTSKVEWSRVWYAADVSRLFSLVSWKIDCRTIEKKTFFIRFFLKHQFLKKYVNILYFFFFSSLFLHFLFWVNLELLDRKKYSFFLFLIKCVKKRVTRKRFFLLPVFVRFSIFIFRFIYRIQHRHSSIGNKRGPNVFFSLDWEWKIQNKKKKKWSS